MTTEADFNISLHKDIIKITVVKPWINAKESEKNAMLGYIGIKKIINENPGKRFKLYVDIRQTEELESIYLKERLYYIRIMTMKELTKLAFVSKSFPIEKIFQMLSKAIKKLQFVKFFKSEKAAMNWLMQEDKDEISS